MKTPVDRLIELHARAGYQFKEFAPFTCPLCGVQPVYSVNVKLDVSEEIGARPAYVVELDRSKRRVVACICCAPFHPKPEFDGLSPWELMPDEKSVESICE